MNILKISLTALYVLLTCLCLQTSWPGAVGAPRDHNETYRHLFIFDEGEIQQVKGYIKTVPSTDCKIQEELVVLLY